MCTVLEFTPTYKRAFSQSLTSGHLSGNGDEMREWRSDFLARSFRQRLSRGSPRSAGIRPVSVPTIAAHRRGSTVVVHQSKSWFNKKNC